VFWKDIKTISAKKLYSSELMRLHNSLSAKFSTLVR